jgi:hypothetical protein
MHSLNCSGKDRCSSLVPLKKWFDIEIHSEVIDTMRSPIEREEY